MRKIAVRPPSVAVVVACLALAIALGGTGSAAVLNVPDGSVTTAKIKNGAVTTAKLKNDAVTVDKLAANAVRTAQVKNGTLLKDDFKSGQLPAGSSGAPRPEGGARPERRTRSERARARRRIDVFELREFEERRRHLPFGKEGHRRRGAGDRERSQQGFHQPELPGLVRQQVECAGGRGRVDRAALAASGVRPVRECELSTAAWVRRPSIGRAPDPVPQDRSCAISRDIPAHSGTRTTSSRKRGSARPVHESVAPA